MNTNHDDPMQMTTSISNGFATPVAQSGFSNLGVGELSPPDSQSGPAPTTAQSAPDLHDDISARLSTAASALTSPSPGPSSLASSLTGSFTGLTGLTGLTGATGANANGKRPISTIENGGDATPPIMRAATPGSNGFGGGSMGTVNASAAMEVHTHAASGYTWSAPEDEPGYAWTNKRAQEEYSRAVENVMRDRTVGNKYGDPFRLAEQERARALRHGVSN